MPTVTSRQLQLLHRPLNCRARKFTIDNFPEPQYLQGEFGKASSWDNGQHYCGGRVLCQQCGALMWLAEKVGASLDSPKFSMCCEKGKVVPHKVPDLELGQVPQFLRDLMSQDYAQFRNSSLELNSKLAFASMQSPF